MTDPRPEIEQGELGHHPKFEELGMQVVSHLKPEFELPNSNQVEVQFKTPKLIRSTANLIQCRTGKDMPEYVFTQTTGDILSFVCSFPEHGYYKLQVFGLEHDNPDKSLPCMYIYLIHVARALNAVHPFPKQFAAWRNGCYLHSPLVLNSSSSLVSVHFKVLVPGAKDVAVVADGDFQHLKKTQGDVFEGNVTGLDKHRGKGMKVSLNASFDDSNRYPTLLEYQV